MAWLFQKPEQVAAMGDSKAPWYVGWYEPDGRRRKKSFGAGLKNRKLAERHKFKLEEELTTGTYRGARSIRWETFCKQYESRVLDGLATRTREIALESLACFARIINPVKVSAMTTAHIDEFIAARRQEPGKKKGDVVSPATVNKDLRHVKAALSEAVEWGYLAKLPRFRMEKAPEKLPRYVTGEHFAAIYQACESAGMPDGLPNLTPGDWWQALLVMAYMTGWRIGDMMALRRDQVDLNAGTALSLAEHNKGKRDELAKLHTVVVDHLRRLWVPSSSPTVFPWQYNHRTLWVQFARIQKAAKIDLPCPASHKHTAACHLYGFHDLRRAFATMNADQLTPEALQRLMRHKSYQTTRGYINRAKKMDEAVAKLHVPEVLRRRTGAG
jgi:integrase